MATEKKSTALEKKKEQAAAMTITKSVKLPPEAVMLLKTIGVEVPENIREITVEVTNTNETQRILIPEGMSKLAAAKELELMHKNEEQVIDVAVDFEGWNWKDVLIAVKRVTETVFGWIHGRPTWWSNPTEIDVVVDVRNGKPTIEKAFINNFSVGPWDKAIANVWVNKGQAGITVNVKRKFNAEVTQYFNLIRNQLENYSIYRGRNIVVKKDAKANLEFEIIEPKGSDKIVLNRNTQLVIDQFILNGLNESGKRTYLFTGNYGNGKTETAMSIGAHAVNEHEMSFFYIKDASLFDEVIVQCKKYQPCVIFLEDIDEVTSGEDRDARINRILNTLDGVQTKGNNITTIFTTNHPEKIASAMRRPGRIDLYVRFENPDAESQERIMRKYFDTLEGAKELNYERLISAMPNVTGAVVAEICGRAVTLAKQRGRISDDIIMAAGESMAFQIEMMEGTAKGEANELKQFVLLASKVFGIPFTKQLEEGSLPKTVAREVVQEMNN